MNAMASLARCLCWFNPLVHVAAHLMRIDQEIACDAGVITRNPRARASYAQTLLKSQGASVPLPLGCYWPTRREHPLTERVAMLDRGAPSRIRQATGLVVVLVLSFGCAYTAWATTPLQPAPSVAQGDTQDANADLRPVYDRPLAEDYDLTRIIDIEGAVVRVDWSKPKSAVWVYGRGRGEDGVDLGERIWQVEGGNPFVLSPEQRALMKGVVGHKIAIRGYGAKDDFCSPLCRVHGRNVTFAEASSKRMIVPSIGKPDCTMAEVLAYKCRGSEIASPPPEPPTETEIQAAVAASGRQHATAGASSP